jgi:hypothetical protein
MFLRTVPIGHNGLKFRAILGRYGNCDTIEHATESHA